MISLKHSHVNYDPKNALPGGRRMEQLEGGKLQVEFLEFKKTHDFQVEALHYLI